MKTFHQFLISEAVPTPPGPPGGAGGPPPSSAPAGPPGAPPGLGGPPMGGGGPPPGLGGPPGGGMSMGPGMPGEGQPQAQAVPVKRVDALDLWRLLRKSLDKKSSGQKQKNALE